MLEKNEFDQKQNNAPRGRIARLRERLVKTRPEVFSKRALLVTEAWREAECLPPVIRNATALDRVLRKDHIQINPDELIVGCKVPLPKGSPLYPEFNVAWLEEELDTLAQREETPFMVSGDTKALIKNEILPFWKGRTVYDHIVAKAPKKSLACATEGLFFHYYLDRSIGHITVNYEKVLQLGISGIKARIKERRQALEPSREDYSQKNDFYKALDMVADSIVAFSHRYAGLAAQMAAQCTDPGRKKELEKISEICRRVPEYPAQTLHEALQSFWFVHLVLNLESNSYAISPGRFCQYIYPYYKSDLEKGEITPEKAQELINCLWIKFNELTVVKAGATAKASNTYVDFQNLNIGGLQADGSDGTNDVSWFCLNALDELRLPQPQLSCLISSKTDKAFLMRACEVVREGTGMPAVFNDDVKVLSLLGDGKTLADSRRGGVNGCVEVNAQGCDNMASSGYVNLVKCLELALNNGVSMTTGKRLGPATGEISDLKAFDDVWTAFSRQLEAAVALKVSYDDAAREVFAEHCPVVFTSLVTDDCIDKGKEFHQGGARYNAPMMCGVGLGTLADSLAAIEEFCFKTGRYPLSRIHTALMNNFESEPLLQKQLWRKGPKFGNNDDRVDRHAKDAVDLFSHILAGHVNRFGEAYRANMIPTNNPHSPWARHCRNAGRTFRPGPIVRGRLPGSGPGHFRPYGSCFVPGQGGPRQNGRHSFKHEIHALCFGRTGTTGKILRNDPHLF